MPRHHLASRTAMVALAMMILVLGLPPSRVIACPFCNAVSQTLRQEMEVMDAVVIATAVDTDATRDPVSGDIRMRVTEVLRGDSLVQVGDEVTAVYYGKVDPGRVFMLSGVDPPQLLWSTLPLSPKAAAYVKKIPTLGEDPAERLRFYYPHLQDDDTMLSRDAYDEFAIAPYDVIKQLTDIINQEDLVTWLNEPELPTDRKRLYLTLLGIVGDESNLPMLEQRLRSTQKSTRGGLDALIACYLTLAGEQGLPLISELFLANKKAPYADTYAAIMAIRFHGTEGDVIARSALMESLHPILERPDLADLVIPDLARWKDWSVIDDMVALFVESDPEANWVRVPVVNYLRACPLPAAAEALVKLESIDPESVRRANTFFMIPVPARDVPATESRTLPHGGPKSDLGPPTPPLFTPIAQATVPGPPTAMVDFRPSAAPNPIGMLSVMLLGLMTLVIAQWLVLSGGATPQRQATRSV